MNGESGRMMVGESMARFIISPFIHMEKVK